MLLSSLNKDEKARKQEQLKGQKEIRFSLLISYYMVLKMIIIHIDRYNNKKVY